MFENYLILDFSHAHPNIKCQYVLWGLKCVKGCKSAGVAIKQI